MAKQIFRAIPPEEQQPPPGPEQPGPLDILALIDKLAQHLNVGNVIPEPVRRGAATIGAGLGDWSGYQPAALAARGINRYLDARQPEQAAEAPAYQPGGAQTYLPMVQGRNLVTPFEPPYERPGTTIDSTTTQAGTDFATLPGRAVLGGVISPEGVARGRAAATPPTTAAVSGAAAARTTAAAPTGAVGPSTGWTDEEARAISRATVGRDMGLEEMEAWIGAFYQEHGGTPWQIGPFDSYNNLLDHLIALGESERQVAMGMASPYTKAGAEGNIYADPAITPGFWDQAYYGRYAGPTYMTGPGGLPISTGTRPLYPGQLPPLNAPSELAAYGELSPRQFYQYRTRMRPEEWELPAPPTAMGGISPYYASLYGQV